MLTHLLTMRIIKGSTIFPQTHSHSIGYTGKMTTKDEGTGAMHAGIP